MTSYRFYCFVNGHITRAEDHLCEGDKAARERAVALIFLVSHKWCELVEVWQRDRLVAAVRRSDLGPT